MNLHTNAQSFRKYVCEGLDGLIFGNYNAKSISKAQTAKLINIIVLPASTEMETMYVSYLEKHAVTRISHCFT